MKEVLKKEIEVCNSAIVSMEETIKKCQQGILIQNMVLQKFKEELKCISTS